MQYSLLLKVVLGLAISASVTAPAWADPSGRVGRLSYVEGDVTSYDPAQNAWFPASRNYPVASGQSYWTDQGRAEIQVGPVVLWLDHASQVTVSVLDYGVAQFDLPEGSVDVRIWDMPRGGVQFTTPLGVVRLDQPGVYRIDAGHPRPDGQPRPLRVTVLQGLADAPGPNGGAHLATGQEAIDDGVGLRFEGAYVTDLDAWSRSREGRYSAAEDYLSDDYTGGDDLSRSGQWVQTSDYGPVWYPNDVPYDWAPYRYGHWAYIAPWGWTWIDDAPWGFAPFHYGRWAVIEGRWGWAPGRPVGGYGDPGHRRYEPVYAPALVTFVGGADFSLAVSVRGGGGHVGWVPLAPDEVYRPPYAVSASYVRQVNVVNVKPTIINQTIVNNTVVNNTTNVTVYKNFRAATVVTAGNFTSAAPVQKSTVAVPPQAWAKASVTPNLSHVAPPPSFAQVRGAPPAAGAGHGPASPQRMAPQAGGAAGFPHPMNSAPVNAVKPQTPASSPVPAQPGTRSLQPPPIPVKTQAPLPTPQTAPPPMPVPVRSGERPPLPVVRAPTPPKPLPPTATVAPAPAPVAAPPAKPVAKTAPKPQDRAKGDPERKPQHD